MTLADKRIDMVLEPAAAAKLRAATSASDAASASILVRVGNEVVIAPPVDSAISNPFGFAAPDIEAAFAKLCPKPERRSVPATLKLPPG